MQQKKQRNHEERRPASLGTALQQHWPLVSMKLMSFLSSSAVHGPFFNPTLSQHGCLPILVSLSEKNRVQAITRELLTINKESTSATNTTPSFINSERALDN